MRLNWFKQYPVRGSPLLRTFLTAIGLGLAAWPLWQISRSTATPNVPGPDPSMTTTPASAVTVPFQLQLSSAAKHIELRDENDEILWQTNDSQNSEFSADLKRLPLQIAVKISWSGGPTPRYFAKLILDAPERESLIHVFDAGSDIDDLWELP